MGMMLQEILRKLESLDSRVSNRENASQEHSSKGLTMKEGDGTVEKFHRDTYYYHERPTRQTKIEFPVFDGSRVQDWIFRSERFFELEATPPELKVSIASVCLIGLAMDWHYAFTKNRKIPGPVSWEEYAKAMTMRFGSNDLQRLIAQLKRLKEGDSFFDYVDAFVALVSQVDLPDEDQVAMFIEGMKPGNQRLVTVLGPRNLQQAIALPKTLSTEIDPYGGKRREGYADNGKFYNRQGNRSSPPPVISCNKIPGNRYVFAAAMLYPGQFPNPLGYYPQYLGYYPLPPPVAGPYGQPYGNWVGGQYPCGAVPVPVTPYVEHQKALTIRNDVNIKKESLRVEPDESDPGKYVVSFAFDATDPGRDRGLQSLVAMREDLFKPFTMSFQQGLAQKFRQPLGTGVDSLLFEDMNLRKDGDVDVYPLVVKAEACPVDATDADGDQNKNSQIIQAVIEKEKGEYRARVVKQILWVNRMRYELLEIYGIGNAVDGDIDGNDPAKECVIFLSELRDTTVLPCRHMCMCSGCAKVLRYQTNRCPICRQPVERLLEIKVNNETDESGQSGANEA